MSGITNSAFTFRINAFSIVWYVKCQLIHQCISLAVVHVWILQVCNFDIIYIIRNVSSLTAVTAFDLFSFLLMEIFLLSLSLSSFWWDIIYSFVFIVCHRNYFVSVHLVVLCRILVFFLKLHSFGDNRCLQHFWWFCVQSIYKITVTNFRHYFVIHISEYWKWRFTITSSWSCL